MEVNLRGLPRGMCTSGRDALVPFQHHAELFLRRTRTIFISLWLVAIQLQPCLLVQVPLVNYSDRGLVRKNVVCFTESVRQSRVFFAFALK